MKTTDYPTNVIVVYTQAFANALQGQNQNSFDDVLQMQPGLMLYDYISQTNNKVFTSDIDLVPFLVNGVIQYCNSNVIPKWGNSANKLKLQAIIPNIDTLINFNNGGGNWSTSQNDFNAIVKHATHSFSTPVTTLDNAIVIVLSQTTDLNNAQPTLPIWIKSIIDPIDPIVPLIGVHGNVGSTIFTWINYENAIDITTGSMQLCVGNQRNTVSLVMSHELAEIIANPWGTNLFYSGIPTVYYEKEIADPVQYNIIAMYVGGSGTNGSGTGGFYMSMTDFVLTNYFTTTSHTAPFCFGQILDIAKPTTSIPTLYMYLNLQWFPIDNVTIDKKAPKLTLSADQ